MRDWLTLLGVERQWALTAGRDMADGAWAKATDNKRAAKSRPSARRLAFLGSGALENDNEDAPRALHRKAARVAADSSP